MLKKNTAQRYAKPPLCKTRNIVEKKFEKTIEGYTKYMDWKTPNCLLFVTIPTELLNVLFMTFNKLAVKCIWKSKGPRIYTKLLKIIRTEGFIL